MKTTPGRFPRVIVVAATVLGGVFLLLFALQSSYLRFVEKDTAYYRQFADGCDLLLQKHPIGTNDWVMRHGYRSPENSIQLSGNDASLPKIIRALHPENIVISSNRVFVGVGVGRGGFGIVWEQDSGTNGWSLQTFAEGLVKTHYKTTKF